MFYRPRCQPNRLTWLAVPTTLGLITLGLGPLGSGPRALAQSSTRSTYGQPQSTYTQPGSTVVPQGSATRSTTASRVALEGYCPVCVIEMKKWVRGNPSIAATYDGKTYFFPGDEQKQMFLAAPDKYVPVLGGDCVVCVKDMGARSPGSIRHSALSQKRLYLFPSEQMKMKFAADPRRYIDADVALNGSCSVCRVEMKQEVAGNPDVFVRHGGLKYQFASEDQKKMFMANPGKYTIKDAAAAAGSTTK